MKHAVMVIISTTIVMLCGTRSNCLAGAVFRGGCSVHMLAHVPGEHILSCIVVCDTHYSVCLHCPMLSPGVQRSGTWRVFSVM